MLEVIGGEEFEPRMNANERESTRMRKIVDGKLAGTFAPKGLRE